MQAASPPPLIAIACGGTGGHLFPGLALGEELAARGCDLLLLISPKEVDQQAVKAAVGMQVATLPAVALQRGVGTGFLRGLWRAYTEARRLFRERPPAAIIGMGGFSSFAPVLAGKRLRAATFLHEGNSVPGRANRWLAHAVDQAFVYFPSAARRLWNPIVRVTGMPVRSQFVPLEPEGCRAALGLDPARSTLLITGGSQGASPLNEAMLAALPALIDALPELQFLHLTGPGDAERVRAAYAARSARAVVRPFLTEMELALGAATVAVSRAGASSLAEQAAMRLPALLVPYPHAADNHQLFNARAFVESGAAGLLQQGDATPERLGGEIRALLWDATRRLGMRTALRQWHAGDTVSGLADIMLRAVGQRQVPPPAARVGLAVARLGLPGLKPLGKTELPP